MTDSYLNDILEQPRIIEECAQTNVSALDADLGRFSRVVLTAMGGSYHSLYPLWLTLSQRLSLPALMVETSELIHYAPEVITDDTLLIVVSQSGETVELVRLTERARRPGRVIAVTNGTNNTVARWTDVALDTHAGEEKTVSTKTYTAGLAVLHLLGAYLTGSDLAQARDVLISAAQGMRAVLDQRAAALAEYGAFVTDFASLVTVARGHSVGDARLAALMMAEATKTAAVAMSTGQFRHGPLELVRAGFGLVMFSAAGPASAIDDQLARDVARLGGRCLMVTPRAVEPSDGVRVWRIPSAPPQALPLVEIVPAQLLTFPLAEARGFAPGVFLNITKVTTAE